MGSGLLQTLDISSDNTEVLQLALQLPWTWDSSGMTHMETGRVFGNYRGDRGADYIAFFPFDCGELLALPYAIKTPAMLFDFVRRWLASANYGEPPDTDGSLSWGWRVTRPCFPGVVAVQTAWIIYEK